MGDVIVIDFRPTRRKVVAVFRECVFCSGYGRIVTGTEVSGPAIIRKTRVCDPCGGIGEVRHLEVVRN